LDLAFGEDTELALVALFNGIQNGSIRLEVKTDDLAVHTGNLYLEYEHKPRGAIDHMPSGIATTRADWWAFQVGPVTILSPTSTWRDLGREAFRRGLRRECARGDNPTRGVVLPIADMLDMLPSVKEAER